MPKKIVSDVMLTIKKKNESNKFQWNVGHVSLSKVANIEKMLAKKLY